MSRAEAAAIGLGDRFKGTLPPLTSALAERAARAFGQGKAQGRRTQGVWEILQGKP